MGNPKLDDKHITRREWIGGILALILILASVTAWSICKLEFGSGIGLLGSAISSAGFIVAILIFLNQKRHSDASEKRILKSIEEKARSEASRDVAESTVDAYEAETLVMEQLGTGVGKGVLRLWRDDIPLRLIRDVVVGWEKAGESGSWTINAVLCALRRQGKGNHAWWLVASDPQSGHERIFKVAKGGRGNDSASDVSVTEVK